MDPHPAFGDWVKRRRRSLALTQDELAQRTAYSSVMIRKVESGDLRPSKALAEKLAEALEIPAEEREAFLAFARGSARAGGPGFPPPALPLPPRAAGSEGPHGLPAPLTPLIGRARELNAAGDLLARPAARLVTLTGPGGIGKTRLAIRLAEEHSAAFGHGVYFISLAEVDRAERLVPAIASALDVHAPGQKDQAAQLVEFLRDRQALLILDNCEHLGGIEFFAEILRAAPGVKLLATSRERLHVPGEYVFEVGGLQSPAANAAEEEIAGSDAVALFVELARRSDPGFGPSPGQMRTVAQICRLVEGMPLAIELAAAWVRALTVEEIASEIGRDFRFLAHPMAGVPERHQSVGALFDHSWEVLTGAERRAASMLSVFVGGFRAEAARYVAGAPLSLLASLVDKSLLEHDRLGRYTMHGLLRQYALGRLPETGEADRAQARHFEFFLGLVEEAEPQLRGGPHQGTWLDRLEAEHDNMRAALAWGLGDEAQAGPAVDAGLTMAVKLRWFWYWRGYWSEGRKWLTARRSADVRLQAEALSAACFLAVFEGDYEAMNALAEEARGLYRELTDTETLALWLDDIGMALELQGEYAAARACLTQALALQRGMGDRGRLAHSLINLASAALLDEDYAAASAAAEEVLELTGEGAGPGERAGPPAGEPGDERSAAWSRLILGLAALLRGEASRAAPLLLESLGRLQRLGDKPGVHYALIGLAGSAAGSGETVRAARLFGAAESYGEACGLRLSPGHRAVLDRLVAALRDRLDPESLSRAWGEGRGLSLEEAAGYAI